MKLIPENKKYLFFLLLIVPLYLSWTFDHSLWNPDETRDAGIAAEMYRYGNYMVPKLNGEPFLEKPPLYYWTSAAVYAVTNRITAGTTRLPAALYGMLGILFTFLIGRRLFSERVGLFAAAILATSAQYFRMSHFAMMDVPLAALTAGALYFYLRGSKIGFAAFTVLAFFAKGFLGIILPGVVVTLDLAFQKKWLELAQTIGVGALLFTAFGGAWLWQLWKQGGADFLKIFLIDNHWTRFFHESGDHTEHFWFFYFLTLPVDFLPWSPLLAGLIIEIFRKPYRLMEPKPLRFLFFWFFGLLFFFSLSTSKRSIYLLPLFPATALLCAAWLDEKIREHASEEKLERRIHLLFASAAGIIIVSSFFLPARLDRDKSFVPVCDAVKEHAGSVIGYNLNEMERGVFGFYLGGPLINPRDPAQFEKTMVDLGVKPFALIVNRNKIDEIRDKLPKQSHLAYEHRRDKKTRSYQVYVN